MINLKIVEVGNPVLRDEAKPLSKEQITDPAIQQLIELMKSTMRDAPGVGLAAPQIGLSLQIVVIEDRAEYFQGLPEEEIKKRERKAVPLQVLINPKITWQDNNTVEFFEGCLSVPKMVSKVPRAKSVKVEALNERGEAVVIEASGWYARILQHEIDHLHGTLNIDRMAPRSLATVENYSRFVLGIK